MNFVAGRATRDSNAIDKDSYAGSKPLYTGISWDVKLPIFN